MSYTPATSIDYFWKGGDTSSITADWYYTVGATLGLTAGDTGGILKSAVEAGSTAPGASFSHVFTMNAVRDGSVVEVSTISGTPQTTGYVTDIVGGSSASSYTIGLTGHLGTGSAPYLGGTASSWDYKEHWLVKISGITTGSVDGTSTNNSAFTGDGYYFAPAVRPAEGGDRVHFEQLSAEPKVGISVNLPFTNLESGGWNGTSWGGSTGNSTTPCSVYIESNYNYPIGVTTGTPVAINADEVRMKNDSNYEVVWSNGSSLGYVISEGTHSLRIEDSTIHTLELLKSSYLNDSGQYGNFYGRGNTYNHAINILGYASGRFVHISGYGGSGGYVPYVNVAPAYRDPITIDVDVNKLAVAPAGIQSGHYTTVKPVKIISTKSNHKQHTITMVQSPENDTLWGQFIGHKTNNSVEIHCGMTIDNHVFESGSLDVGSGVMDDDVITIVDGSINSNCKINTIHPNNPNFVGFRIGENHGNTIEGYLVTDDQGDAEFVFSRGHYVKANFGNRGDASSGIVSGSGGK